MAPKEQPSESNLQNVDASTFAINVVQLSHQFPVVVLFHAKWHPPSRQMISVLSQMQKEFGDSTKFCVVDADENEKLVRQEGVHSYPTVAIQRFGACVRRIVGAHPPELHAAVKEVLTMKELAPNFTSNPSETEVSPDEKERLYNLANSAPVMLFIKGSKESPFCKFSKEAVTILNDLGVEFEAFDVFQDRSVRDGLKLLFDWPTFPQLYLKGELIGGVDIMKDMVEDGSLMKTFEGAAVTHKTGSLHVRRGSSLAKTPSDAFHVGLALKQRLQALVERNDLMLFMKGTPEEPRCGFSTQIVDLLAMCSITYDHFDILTDNEVREGLKALYDWPTYPQFYAYGELIGGLDVIKDIISNGGPQAFRQEIELCEKKTFEVRCVER